MWLAVNNIFQLNEMGLSMSKEVNLIVLAKESSMEDACIQTHFNVHCDLLFDKCMCQVACFEDESQIRHVQKFGEANGYVVFDDSFKKYRLKLTLEEYEE